MTGATAGSGDLFTTSGGTQNMGSAGATIAQLELVAPSRQSFVLKGTIPVPAYTYPRPDNLEPFSVLNPDGSIAPTQVEIVSRFADDNKGADVVEVLARVSLPPNTAPGTQVVYSVVEHAHPKSAMPIQPEVLALLSTPSSVLVKSKDCFGHEYQIDVLAGMRHAAPGSRLMRKGQAAVQLRNYGVMKPNTSNLGAPNGALAHFLGVHSYMTAWALDPAFSLDLRFNNGPDGHDTTTSDDNPLGNRVYFKSVELWVPQGWTVQQEVIDPFLGQPYNQAGYTVYPLVAPMADGSLHVIGRRGQFHRRLGIARVGHENDALALVREEAQAFVKRGFAPAGNELYSWWNPQTSHYFPQRQKLPDLSYLGYPAMRSAQTNTYNWIKNHLQGTAIAGHPLETGPLGWARPWGNAYGGMTGGSEIYLFDGLELAECASNKGYLAVQMTHRMYTDRQPMSLYDLHGDPTLVESWIVQGPSYPYVPIQFFLDITNTNDPFGFASAPQYQVQWVAAQNKKPAYEALLMSFGPIDYQHYIRYTRSPKILAWLGNDALSKDDLRLAADVFRLSYHGMYTSSSGYMMSSQLITNIHQATHAPGTGVGFGRGQAWGIDCIAAAHSLSGPESRPAVIPWARKVTDMLVAGQASCSGFIQAEVNSKWLGGMFRARQNYEQAIVENALMGLRKSVLEGVDPARAQQLAQVTLTSLQSMIGPLSWSTHHKAPYSVTAVGPLSGPIYCSGLPQGGVSTTIDKYQCWSSMAYGYQLSGDQEFFLRAQEMAGTTGNLLTWLKGQGFTNLGNRAALIATLQ